MKLPVIQLMQREQEMIRTLNLKSRIEALKHSLQISCKPGCNACCFRRIDISLMEAIVLLAELKRVGKWKEVRKRVKSHPSLTITMDPDTWASIKTMCPVNDNGRCLGYSSRPVACSSRFSSIDPSFCDPHNPESIPTGIMDVTIGFDILQKYLNAHGLTHRVPIPEALLIAETIYEKEYADIDDVVSAMKGAK